MKIHTHDEMLDHIIGEKGTPRRDAFDAQTEAFLTDEAIKAAPTQANASKSTPPTPYPSEETA